MASNIRGFDSQIKELYLLGLSSRKIAEHLNCSKTTISNIIKKLGISRGNLDWQRNKDLKESASLKTSIKRKGIPQNLSRVYQIDNNLFKNINNEFEAYLFGIILTDGHVGERTISLMVSNDDIEWMKSLSKKLNINLKVDNRGYPYFNINSVNIVSTLRSLGVNKNKTSDPQQITIPLMISDFIRGLIDGDGSIIIRDDGYVSISFGNTNKQLVDLVRDKGRQYGSKCSTLCVNNWKSQNTAKRPYKLPFYKVSIYGKAAKLLLNEIYYKDCFAIPRKYIKAREGIEWQK